MGSSYIPLPVETILSMALQSCRKCSLRCVPEIILLESLCQVSERNVCAKCVCVCVREQAQRNVNALTRAAHASLHSTTGCDGGRYFNGSLTFQIVMCTLCAVKDQAGTTRQHEWSLLLGLVLCFLQNPCVLAQACSRQG